ncbi:protein DpdG [Rhizobium sp. BT-226]|uniref:protein DpdG n=1 Tax=Rhizobium sp. BT-226 TaxID=2986922 RepID=UPI0021F794E2|nr:protein DpdG [Rhizobium sp. BT-226]MCW0021402.1 protein DpdG [Rhizobium sp. BT-226]
MSIITTVEAVPSRLYAIYSSLFDSESGEVRERLEAWATPPSLKNSGEDGEGPATKLFIHSLQEARRLGLVEDMDDKLLLTLDARNGGKRGDDSEAFFREYMLRTLFDPIRAEEAQQSAFMLALTWLLSTNPLKPMGFSDDPNLAIKMIIGEHARKTECTIGLNYQNMLYWARYLGFATVVGNGAVRRVIPNPITAIEGALPAIFADDDELPIENFLTRLAAIYPVFEKGSVRERFNEMRLVPLSGLETRLSVTTSIALQRLADRQRLGLKSVADAPARILDFGTREGRVSHIALRGSK